MATRFAIATGNWSNTAIWDNGALPLPEDDVYANGFTVTIDQNVNVGSVRNTTTPVRLPNMPIPVMTGNTSTFGIAFGTGSNPFQAFDQNTGTGYSGFQLGYQFFTPIIIRSYAFYTGNNSQVAPTAWTFQGSNDGTTWTTLDTQTTPGSANTWFQYQFSNALTYTYYRINVTGTVGAGQTPGIFELNMSTSTATTYGGTAGGSFTLNGGVTVTATDTLYSVGSGSVLTYSASSPASSTLTCFNTIIGTGTSGQSILHSGSGTLTVNANLSNFPTGVISTNRGPAITVSGVGATLNINGNVGATASGQSATMNTINVISASTVNITGNITNTSANANAGVAVPVNVTAAATINVIGNLTAAVTTNNTSGNVTCITASAGNINITGNVTGGSTNAGSNGALGAAVYHTGSGAITITGNVTGNISAGVHTTSTASVTITGNVTAGTGGGCGFYTTAAGSYSITGVCTASTTAPAVFSSSTSATNTFTGPFVSSNNNIMAVQVARLLLTTTPTYWRFQSDARTMYTADYAPDYPSTFNVRSGVSYNGGLMTGTMVVPPAASVVSGVPVDNTVGTAAISTAAVQSAIFDKDVSTLTTPNSIGVRVKNSITANTMGSLLSS